MATERQIEAAERALADLDAEQETWPTGEQVEAIIDAVRESANDHAVTTVMVTIAHPVEETGSEVADRISSWMADRAPGTWGFGTVVASSSVGTQSFGDDEIDWRMT